MASHVYPLAKESFITGAIDLSSNTIKVALVTSAYTYSAAHQFRSSLSGVIVTSGALASKTVTNGTFDAADLNISTVTSGSTIAAIVGYKDTGNSATDNLIWIEDGFSQATNGGDIGITWDSGSDKIFTI